MKKFILSLVILGFVSQMAAMDYEKGVTMASTWYDEHAQEWHERTKDLNVDFTYQDFLKELPITDEYAPLILDAGCGGGRFAKVFLDVGYRVEAFDASSEMVKLATTHVGIKVRQLTFQEMDYESKFDGIWANASLLHVQRDEMKDVFHRLIRALKPGGVLYASFKKGQKETFERGRLFNNYDEETLRAFVESFPELHMSSLKICTSEDIRPERKGRFWVRMLCRKD